jgi:hypothetical protein
MTMTYPFPVSGECAEVACHKNTGLGLNWVFRPLELQPGPYTAGPQNIAY